MGCYIGTADHSTRSNNHGRGWGQALSELEISSSSKNQEIVARLETLRRARTAQQHARTHTFSRALPVQARKLSLTPEHVETMIQI